MKRILVLVLIAASALAQQPQRRRVMIGGGDIEERTKDWPRAEAGLAAFEKFFDAMAARDLFSGTVLVAKGNDVVLQKTVGFADKEKRISNTADTKFNLGSINKIFTTVALRQLRAAGKIDFSKTLRTYLPDYPSKIADLVTIQQLLEHSSGMGDFFGPDFDAMPKEKLRSNADYLPLFVNQPLEFDPGTKRRYSNAGYIVLGLVIEKLSGMSYYDYVRKNIYAPAGMNDSDSYPVDAKVANRAIGYAGAEANTSGLPGRGSSAGGGYSTAADLLRFTRALPKLLSREDYLRVVGDPPGVGWGGGAPGINAAVEMEGDYTIIVLSNYSPPSAQHVAKNARRALGLGGDED